jgi:hypothetical protein
MNRGLFNSDKLTIATQLCLRILLDTGELKEPLVRTLMIGAVATSTPPDMSSALAEWLPDTLWPKVKALETIKPVFEKLGDDLQLDASGGGKWRQWFDDEKPETLPLPGPCEGTLRWSDSVYTFSTLVATLFCRGVSRHRFVVLPAAAPARPASRPAGRCAARFCC